MGQARFFCETVTYPLCPRRFVSRTFPTRPAYRRALLTTYMLELTYDETHCKLSVNVQREFIQLRCLSCNIMEVGIFPMGSTMKSPLRKYQRAPSFNHSLQDSLACHHVWIVYNAYQPMIVNVMKLRWENYDEKKGGPPLQNRPRRIYPEITSLIYIPQTYQPAHKSTAEDANLLKTYRPIVHRASLRTQHFSILFTIFVLKKAARAVTPPLTKKRPPQSLSNPITATSTPPPAHSSHRPSS